jgi:hypothetical protein
MKLREYERLKRLYVQKRDALFAQAEAEYRRNVDALEIVWDSARELQDSQVVVAHSAAKVTEPHATTGRSTGVRKAIRDAISEHAGDFNTEQIFEKVKETFPDVKRQTVADALFRMANKDKGEIEVVTPGVGRRPAVYRHRKHEGPVLEPVAHESEGMPM